MHQLPIIMVIDDNAEIRSIINRLFSARGYCVCEAAYGSQAIERARAHIPVLIILDLCLPGQDGLTVAHELRADPALEHTPILVITSYGYETLSLVRAAGCQSLLCKPFNLKQLTAMVDALLQQD